MLLPLHLNGLNLDSGTALAVVTGTLAGATEAQIVSGGLTTIITLTSETWIAAGAAPVGSEANSQAIIDGVTSAQSELTGWNNEVRDNEVTGSIVRDSNTQITITWTAAPSYDIIANETLTITVPAQALTGAAEITATPTISIVAVGGGGVVAIFRHNWIWDTYK